MNIFVDEKIAQDYDIYYGTEQGKQIDKLEKQAILELLKPIEPGKMLEIGCGTGHWTSLFSESGFEITATDVSAPMMLQAKQKGISNVIFEEADVCQLPFPDNHFDQVAAITSLEFCGNIEKAFAEIKRVLKPGGWMIAGCLNANSTLGKIKDNDPVLKHGYFMNKQELANHLSTIGNPKIIECAHLAADFSILDDSEERNIVNGIFMAASAQKI